MRFLTESGSLYEVNTATKQIRRICGQTSIHKSFVEDGQWRTYEDLFLLEDYRAIIFWNKVSKGKYTITLTSLVSKIEDNKNHPNLQVNVFKTQTTLFGVAPLFNKPN